MRLDPLAGDPQLTVPRPSAAQVLAILYWHQADRFVAVRVYLLMDERVVVVCEFSKAGGRYVRNQEDGR